MLFNPQFFAQTIETISNELEVNPVFKTKCDEKFVEIVHAIKDEFKYSLGFYQTSLWVSKILQSETRKNFSKIVALSVTIDQSKTILDKLKSEKDFKKLVRKGVMQAMENDKLFMQTLIDEFLSMELFLPDYCFKNDLLKMFLYGNFSIN